MKDFEKFEDLTAKIFQALNDIGFKVTKDVKIEGPDGPRQIDVFLEGELGPMSIRTIIECKDYNKNISVTTVDELHSKMKDVKAHVAVLVARKGFSKGAVSKAKRLGIKLYTAHQALSEKWDFDIDIPILIEEVAPIVEIQMRVHLEKEQSFNKELIVNDTNIFEEFYNVWNNSNFDEGFNNKNVLEILKLQEPYFMRDLNSGDKIELKSAKAIVIFSKAFYFGNVRELKNSMLLNDIVEGKKILFFKCLT